MSWGITAIGTKSEVIKAVNATQNMPQGIKDAIAEILSEPDTSGFGSNGAMVTGHGHSGGGYGSIGKLEVMQLPLLGVTTDVQPAGTPALDVPADLPALAPDQSGDPT